MKIYFILLIILSMNAFSEEVKYTVEEDDTLSTILYSAGDYDEGELDKLIKKNAEKNKLKSKDLIQPQKTLELKIRNRIDCNIEMIGDGEINIKNKFYRTEDKDKFLASRECNPNRKNYKHKFFIGYGYENTRLEESGIFEGTVKSRDMFFYDLELNIGHNPGKSRTYLLHSLSHISYKKTRRNTNTMEFHRESLFKPTYGIQTRSDNDLHNASVALMMETTILAIDRDVDTLEMTPMYSPTLQIGLHLTPWSKGLLELLVSAGPGTGHDIHSISTQRLRLTHDISKDSGLMLEVFHSDANGGREEQYTEGLKGAVKFDF